MYYNGPEFICTCNKCKKSWKIKQSQDYTWLNAIYYWWKDFQIGDIVEKKHNYATATCTNCSDVIEQTIYKKK